MKRINWKLLNIALWIEVILAYFLPYKVIDEFQLEVGYPIPFLSVYYTSRDVSPMMSTALNPLVFLADGILIYFVLVFLMKVNQKRLEFKVKRNR